MRLTLVAVGRKMPAWVMTAFSEYNKRLPDELRLDLKEITPARRNKSTSIKAAKEKELQRIITALPKDVLKVVLDENGNHLTSQQLSTQINNWQHDGRDITFIIGGADGLADELLESADLKWSLSKLTLPHTLARIVLVEQLYRVWSISQNHPYHRQ